MKFVPVYTTLMAGDDLRNEKVNREESGYKLKEVPKLKLTTDTAFIHILIHAFVYTRLADLRK